MGNSKCIGQVGLGLIVGLTLYLSPNVVIRENVLIKDANNQEVVGYMPENIKSTQTTIPFLKNNNFDYADLVSFMGDHAQTAGWIIFVLVTIFIVTAVSNGANLTDGLDGLATGSSAIIGVTLGILAYLIRTYRLCLLFEHHVYPGNGRVSGLRQCVHRSDDRISMVQRISCPSFHGRYG